jgi:hypothetical protein
VLIDFSILFCFNNDMAKLDDEDLKSIKDLVEVTIDEVIDKRELVTKKDLSHLPTKDEFYEQTGEIIKRLDNLEQEKDVLSHQVSNHEDRIEKIEANPSITTD